MKNNYLQCLILLIFTTLGFGQNAVLCPTINEIISIENLENVPAISNNGDGTVTLTHEEPYITDIFANYTIYNFYQMYPNAAETLQKYYTLSHGDKNLILDLKAAVPADVFFIENEYPNTAISPELIDFLDERTFRLSKYCSIADNFGEPCPEQDVPSDVSIAVTFNYDDTHDMLLMESEGLTECGNSFSIGLRGGIEPNSLQLWTSIPGATTETNYENNPCHLIEDHLYSMLDISCSIVNYGDLIPTIDVDTETLVLYRQNFIFGYHTATFLAEPLSITDRLFENMKVYQQNGNPYLQITKAVESMEIEIMSMTGHIIMTKRPFALNQISIENFANGVYFVRLSNASGQSQIVKLLKR